MIAPLAGLGTLLALVSGASLARADGAILATAAVEHGRYYVGQEIPLHLRAIAGRDRPEVTLPKLDQARVERAKEERQAFAR